MAAPTKREWYYLAQEQRHGPLAIEEISKKVMAREIFPEDCHVWRQGMKDWEIMEQSKAFLPVVKQLHEREAATDARAREAAASTNWDNTMDAEGVTRGVFHFYMYVGWLLPMVLTVALLTELQVYGGKEVNKWMKPQVFSIIPFIITLLLFLKVSGQRLLNAGYSKKKSLTLLIPVYNIWPMILCYFAPSHFVTRKKFDFGAFWMLVILGLYSAGVAMFLVPRVGVEAISPLGVGPAVEKIYKEKTNYLGRKPVDAKKEK
ncbi:DUF4339 domain-containing protein [Rubritalea marina]|uniref:DUF4339 domain-containing protein n=1 Tax=Rubritalea marina TaxID=361055 RepID=UPI00037EF756|nr:DUF4339 domain-containing protein [Rubritalea marina]